MLKTRARFCHKDQTMFQSLDLQSDPVGHNNNNNNIKAITNPLALSLLIGLNNNKCISDSDFVRSPKSPLEFRMLSTMAEPFFLRSSLTAHLNCCCLPANKVGLSIVDSLGDDRIFSPDVVFGPALRIKASEIREKHPKSMKIEKERSCVVFEIGENSSETEANGSFSANCCSRKTRVLSQSKLAVEGDIALSGCLSETEANGSFSANGCSRKTRVLSQSKWAVEGDIALSGCLSEDDMEMSEDYTCIISHGPNPKITHIYGDRVLEGHKNELKRDDDNKGTHIENELESMFPSDDFLSFCNFCNKKLNDGEDIYMYREKAFCSMECRSEEMMMMIDEEDLEDSSSKKLF